MKVLYAMLMATLVVGCKMADVPPPKADSGPTYSPVITGVACINGLRWIRVQFTPPAGVQPHVSDMASWTPDYNSSMGYIKICNQK